MNERKSERVSEGERVAQAELMGGGAVRLGSEAELMEGGAVRLGSKTA